MLSSAAKTIRRFPTYTYRPMSMWHTQPIFNSQYPRSPPWYNEGSRLFRPEALRLAKKVIRVAIYLACFIGGSLALLIMHLPISTDWPEVLHKDIRTAAQRIIAREFKGAIDPLTRLWDNIQSLPMAMLSPEPILKILKVSVWLAAVLEAANRPADAYKVLSDALKLRRRYWSSTDMLELQAEASTAPLIDSNGSAVISGPAQLSKRVDYAPCKEERKLVVAMALKLYKLSRHADNAAEMRVVWATLSYVTAAQLAHALDLPGFNLALPNLRKEPTLPTLSEDRLFAYPSWASLTDQEALALPLELMGSIAEKHKAPFAATDIYKSAARIYTRMKVGNTRNAFHLLRVKNKMLRSRLKSINMFPKKADREVLLEDTLRIFDGTQRLIDTLHYNALMSGISGGMYSFQAFAQEVVNFNNLFAVCLEVSDELDIALRKTNLGLEIARAYGLKETQKKEEERMKRLRSIIDRRP